MTTSILQIGAIDWTPEITAPLDWHYTSIFDLPTFLATQKDPYILEQTYVVLTDDVLESSLLSSQIQEWPAFRVIYFATQIAPEFQTILNERRAFSISETTPESVSKRILTDLYGGQQGFSTRFSETQFLPTVPSGIHFSRMGRFLASFEGDFGSEWQQIGTLQTLTTDFIANQTNEIWLDYRQTGTAAAALLFIFYRDGDILKQDMIKGDALRRMTQVQAPADYDSYQIIVLGSGKGQLTLHVVHQRRSRHGLGHLLPGGQWQLTSEDEEVLSYFNPGTLPKPLVVNFSGARLHVDGFEMASAFNQLGVPYLLFTDARMQGGAFDVGSPAYEQTVIDIIKRAMAELNLTSQDVILTGYSMGSYPAMYYAGDIKPGALVLAKPIINLGTLTADAEFAHQYNQDWTLDVRRHLTGYVRPNDTEALNQKLWRHISTVDWSTTTVALLTMAQDNYDGDSLPELLDYLDTHHALLTHQVEAGYHNEKIDEMVDFMMTQLTQLRDNRLAEDE